MKYQTQLGFIKQTKFEINRPSAVIFMVNSLPPSNFSHFFFKINFLEKFFQEYNQECQIV